MSQGLPRQVCVVGLGYVGLPLTVAFARHLPTVGFDIDARRVAELERGYDRNGEVPPEALRAPRLRFTADPEALRDSDFIIVTVPTPVDRAKRPDLSHLTEASRLIGRRLQRGATVVYESTVYPGCTEEVCIPILERESGLRAGIDFKVGYSPERINPGDPEHGLENVVKVVAGQDAETTERLAQVYGLVVRAGIYRAPDIRTAEAAKVIENVQRDLNIALMNELAMLFHRMGLDTQEVLAAARTKWNFLPFEPGLVGGHCIPVDPYYLTHKAQELGYHPEVILAGRRINDAMGRYVAEQTVKLLIRAGRPVRGARVLVLGVTFKENVRDARNSRVLDLVQELEGYGCAVDVHDPCVGEVDRERLGLNFVDDPFERPPEGYDAVVLAVPHRAFRAREWAAYLALFGDARPGVFVDVKGVFREAAKSQGNPHEVIYWSL
jgi:UDP-N-acetyl-D-glucosamine/UDP-N-acetyl-D-galactosamine dehydrogenase